MQPLAPTASTLSPAISHIAVTAEVLVRGRADGDQEAEGQRRRKGQVDTVRWVLGAPERYEDALEKKGSNREDVEEDWAQVKRLLDVWEKNGAEGAKKVKSACEKVLGSMT